jgi:hypothetical protein
MKQIAIIGGGAAGLIAAYYAKKEDTSVTVYEKNGIVGKKLRLTGNGRCNYSNADLSLSHFEHSRGYSEPDFVDSFALEDDIKLIDKVITEDGNKQFSEFLNEIGIVTCEHNGYFYPLSERAGEMTDVLFEALKRKGVEFKLSAPVDTITADAEGKFVIGDSVYDSVILTCGGKAAPSTGSDGGGYRLARNFGHTVTFTYPSLVPLLVREHITSELAGVRVKGGVKGFYDDVNVGCDDGEIQFTKDWISGIPVLQVSRRLTRPIEEKKAVCLEIDFLSFLGEDENNAFLEKRIQNLGELELDTFFEGILPDKLYRFLLSEFRKLDYHETFETDTDKARFLDFIRHYRIEVTGHAGFAQAQCTRGGVLLSEVGDHMESLKTPGVFFAGEMLDVDGDCGGYNLQWAYSSGRMAGENA